MQTRLDEVMRFDAYSEDPDAENSFLYASEAVPVFQQRLDSGEVVLTTTPSEQAAMYGYLHVFRDLEEEGEDRLVVVTRQP